MGTMINDCPDCNMPLEAIEKAINDHAVLIKTILGTETIEHVCDAADAIDNKLRPKRKINDACGYCLYRIENRIIIGYCSDETQAEDALQILSLMRPQSICSRISSPMRHLRARRIR